MDAEFVNVFIQKQRDTINELMARCIMLESKLAVTETTAARTGELEQKIAEYDSVVSNVRAECEASLVQQKNNNEQLVLSLRKQISDLIADNQHVKKEYNKREEELNVLALAKTSLEKRLAEAQKKSQEEVIQLQKSFNDLTIDREKLKNKVDALKKAL